MMETIFYMVVFFLIFAIPFYFILFTVSIGVKDELEKCRDEDIPYL